jgi:hypothetical protein
MLKRPALGTKRTCRGRPGLFGALFGLALQSFSGATCTRRQQGNSLHGRRPPDFVFTAGIGENSPKIRAAVAERLARLGVSLDLAANAEGGAVISRPDSRIPLYVLPTDEELMIARHTLALLTKGSKQQRFEKAS